MESIKKARSRFGNYPKYLKECGMPATEYARCVALKENVMKDDCSKEFNIFKNCILNAAKKHKSKF